MSSWDWFVDFFSDGLRRLAEFLAFLGDHQWAAAIVVLTILVRTLLIPLGVKQVRSMRASQRLQPEVLRLRRKFGKDRQRLQQETMELYKREGVNPLAGCLPIAAQAPLLFAMFHAIRNLSNSPGVGAMPFLGLGDLAVASGSHLGGWLLLAVIAMTGFLSARQLSTAGDAMQQRIMRWMPVVFVVVMLGFPTGVVLYWATQSTFQWIQQAAILRILSKDDDDRTGNGVPDDEGRRGRYPHRGTDRGSE